MHFECLGGELLSDFTVNASVLNERLNILAEEGKNLDIKQSDSDDYWAEETEKCLYLYAEQYSRFKNLVELLAQLIEKDVKDISNITDDIIYIDEKVAQYYMQGEIKN